MSAARSPLVLTASDVRAVLTMKAAMDTIEDALGSEADGGAIVGGRANLMLKPGWMRLAGAALPKQSVLGYKEFHLIPGSGVRYSIQLYDLHGGQLLAIMDGNDITAIRTGAAAGIAMKHLAPPAGIVGIIGAGFEARSQLEALSLVRAPEEVHVFSPRPESRERFCEEMAESTGLTIRGFSDPESVVSNADILLVATTTGGEVALQGQWLHPGMHVSSIGSTLPAQREIDEQVWAAADRVIVDTFEVLTESGDAIAATEAGTLRKDTITPLANIVAGIETGRSNAEQITLYKSIGTPLQDVAVGAAVYREAAAQGLGTELPDYQSLKTVTIPGGGKA